MNNKIKKKDNQLIVTDIERLSEDFSQLQLNEKFSDVTVIVDEIKFNAHKIILSARSEYFTALLYGKMAESSKSEITLKNTTSKAFEKLLKYLYTGSITVDDSETDLVLDVLELTHRLCIIELQEYLVEILKLMLNIENACPILNAANLFGLKDLIECCHSYLDSNAIELLTSDHFIELTQQSAVELLKRDSFFVPEIEIFKAVVKWCEVNENKDDLLVKSIRLTCLDVADIISIVGPSEFFKDYDLLQAIGEIINIKPKTTNCRAQLIPNENVASIYHQAKVISGQNTDSLLKEYNATTARKNAYHDIKNQEGITVKLGAPSIINCIHLLLQCPTDSRYCYSYYIEISVDSTNWNKIIDYSDYYCRGHQYLYFKKQPVRYIRIVGTRSTMGSNFDLLFLEAFMKTDVPNVLNGFIHPITNVAVADKNAWVIESGNATNSLLNESLSGSNNYTFHTINSNKITIQLAQPYVVSNMKLSLYAENIYRYYIEVSVNKTDWEIVVDYRNEDRQKLQIIRFAKRPVVFIRITGTYCSDGSGQFKCVYFECPYKENDAPN